MKITLLINKVIVTEKLVCIEVYLILTLSNSNILSYFETNNFEARKKLHFYIEMRMSIKSF